MAKRIPDHDARLGAYQPPDLNYAERLAAKYERVFSGHVHVYRKIGEERALLGLPSDVHRCRCGSVRVYDDGPMWG